jgi:hypothetical protein
MDDLKVINKMERHPETKMLMEVDELKIKDKDRPNYNQTE